MNKNICEQIVEMAIAADYIFENNSNENNNTHGPKTFEEYYHQHLRNTLIKNGLNIPLSKYLTKNLKTDLDQIDNRLCVNTKFDTLLSAINKCFSLCYNYLKG